MPTKAASRKGSERYRDERRNDPKPKMHGKQWHDHGAAVVEGTQGSKFGKAERVTRPGGETQGVGKGKAGTRGAQGKRMTPVGKGLAGERKRGDAGRNVVNDDKIKSGPKKARR
jgi:hypothetical protein